jgi:hypothetical protein
MLIVTLISTMADRDRVSNGSSGPEKRNIAIMIHQEEKELIQVRPATHVTCRRGEKKEGSIQ